MELNYNRLTQDELIEYVKLLVGEGEKNHAHLDDSIVKKYLHTLSKDVSELEERLSIVKNDDKNKQLLEADRLRDRSLAVFRRSMQIYEFAEDNSAEAMAYEELNALWMKKYETLPYLNIVVETKGIDDLVFDLKSERYYPHVVTLNLQDYIEQIITQNNVFKSINKSDIEREEFKPTYDARALRIEVIDTLSMFISIT